MPAKKAAAAAPKKAAATPAHPSYKGTSQRFFVHNAVGLLSAIYFLGRVSMLIRSCRYGQGSNTQCELIPFAPGWFDEAFNECLPSMGPSRHGQRGADEVVDGTEFY
jgi:hypothetical protein